MNKSPVRVFAALLLAAAVSSVSWADPDPGICWNLRDGLARGAVPEFSVAALDSFGNRSAALKS